MAGNYGDDSIVTLTGVEHSPKSSKRIPNTRYKTKIINGVRYTAHRLIWEEAHGPIPEGHEIHHVNGDGTDNRLENLVCLSTSEHRLLHAKLRREGKDVVDANTPGVTANRAATKKWLLNHKAEKKAYDAKWHAEHKAEKNAKSAKWRAEHPGYSTEQYHKNKERYDAVAKEYARTHKEQRRKTNALYQKRNAELINARRALYEAKKRGSSQEKIKQLEQRLEVELNKREERRRNELQR